jgi:hypothetical protein
MTADTRPGTSWKGDASRLALVLLFAIGVRAVMVANTAVVSRDCIKFVRDALHLEQPPPHRTGPLDVIRHAEYPPGYPVAILGMSHLVRPTMGGTTVETMAFSAQLVSAVAGVLLVIPLYFLVRRTLDRNIACSAALMFTVLPVCVEVTSDGISDGLFVLTAVCALWFAARALDQDRWRRAFGWGLGAGLCCGAGYLVRPDAAIVALGTGLTFAGVVVRRLRGGGWRPPFLAGVGLVVGAVLIAGPYVWAIGGLTNKPAGKGMVDVLSGDEPDPVFFRRDETRLGPGRVPVAAWWDPAAFKDESKPVWAFKNLIYEYLKTGHYVVPVFTAIGLFALRRRLAEPKIALLLTVAAVQFVVLWLLAWKIGYVSQRHTLLMMLVSCVLAAAAFPALGAWAVQAWHMRAFSRKGLRVFTWFVQPERARAWVHALRRSNVPVLAAIWTGIVVAPAIPRDFYSLHAERVGHKEAGLWLAANAEPAAEIVDPFGWAEWYAGRSVRDWPVPDPHYPSWNPFRAPYVYVVFEPNAKSPHSRLEYYWLARNMANPPSRSPRQPVVVYQYPPDLPWNKVRVAVYRCPGVP